METKSEEKYPLEPIDITPFIEGKGDCKELCKKVADQLIKTSCLIIKDPRVPTEENAKFLRIMENYFDQTDEQKSKDIRPELSYQVGATPSYVEKPRDHTAFIKSRSKGNEAHTPKPEDAKWRFFWRIGERPSKTKFEDLNAPPVIPEKFPNWSSVMNGWGEKMLSSVKTVSKMLATGLDLPEETFVDFLDKAPHLLAPTGSNLSIHSKLGDILAGVHYDLNFLTIHGKSQFPALFIWLRDGTKIPVRVPEGCLLIQAGIQLEILTGGLITAGFHEVVVVEKTLEAIEKAKKEGSCLWRVSTTLFSHCASDKVLKPLKPFQNASSSEKYPEILAGDQVIKELTAISLSKN